MSGLSDPSIHVDDSKPPIPPPRMRRGIGQQKLEKLKIAAGPPGRPALGSRSNSQGEDTDCLKGHMNMLVITAKGFRQVMKTRWFVYDKKFGRLRYFRDESELELYGEIDVPSATFCYDVQSDKNGEFTMW